jgi:hypothetical protein
MKELNKLRLLAGITIDPAIEVTEKEQVTESVRLTEAATDAALNDFWCVKKCGKPDSKLGDVLHRTNTQGLCHMIRDAEDDECEDLLIFTGADKAAASKEAKKRIRLCNKAAIEAEEEMFFQKAEQEYEEEMEYEEATKLADKDYDGDGQIETPEEEHRGARARAIQKALNKTEEECEMEEEMDDMDDMEPPTNICPDCEGGEHPPKDGTKCARCDGVGEIYEGKKKPDFLDVDKDGDKKESMKKAEKDKKDVKEAIETKVGPETHEDDEDEAINVVKPNGKTNKAFKDIETVKADPLTTDRPEGDKDESPNQLDALDTPSQQDQSGGGDHDKKINVPANIKKLLKDEADQARKEGKNLNVSNREASYFYDDLAQAFDDLRTHLEGGTVYDLKQAQIFMTSLMGPMLHKIPADVVNFIAKGGEQRSLKDYMQKVDAKFPITGARNALN